MSFTRGWLLAQRDTWLLAELLRRVSPPGDRVLDLCTGTSSLAATAALAGGVVTADECGHPGDPSRRAVYFARTSARLHRTQVHCVRGDLTAPVAGQVLDVVVSNPPYVPVATDELPAHGRFRAFDAGRDGCAPLSRVVAAAPTVLALGGQLLVVHSGLCGVQDTIYELSDHGCAGTS